MGENSASLEVYLHLFSSKDEQNCIWLVFFFYKSLKFFIIFFLGDLWPLIRNIGPCFLRYKLKIGFLILPLRIFILIIISFPMPKSFTVKFSHILFC